MPKSESSDQAPAAAARRLEIVYRDPRPLRPYGKNARTHTPAQVKQIRASIDEFGFTNPILLRNDADIGAGHGRWEAALLDPPLDLVPTITLHDLTEDQWRAYILADNKIALNSGWDDAMLAAELDALVGMGFDTQIVGFDEAELKALLEPYENTGKRNALAAKFLVPPFTVLSARDGWWRDRKRTWLDLGLRSDVGRAKVLATLGSARRAQAGQNVEGWVETSIFDPVLCELAYRWFSPPGGAVLDPFAGGSVRGVVASVLGRRYHGVDLRPEQVAANQAQAGTLCTDPAPAWTCGDSAEVLAGDQVGEADFVFSCPPYADLEVYSDDPRDLSNMSYETFVAVYRRIIALACARLRPDRFACFVVADIRDSRGAYRNFVADTTQAFLDAGLALYNEAVLVTAIGSLPVRAGKQFAATRKLGKTHQNVLVFVKGDPRRATEACGDVEVGDIEADDD